jgi:uncharacterized phage protein gp47/JayE
MTAAAPDRQFAFFQRGELREEILGSFRIGLRQLVNPDTAQPFTEVEIAVATGDLSRWWSEADAIDLVLLAGQGRSLYLVDQVMVPTAGTAFLEGYHGPQWAVSKLPATGGGNDVTAYGAVGTTFIGSTTIGDPAAHTCTDPAGNTYQVLASKTIGGGTSTTITLVGVSTGIQTNVDAGTKFKWATGPLGATDDPVAIDDFTGGTNEETDAEFAQRILDGIRHKAAAGNPSHIRSWARAASNAVSDAYVYPCAWNAGSVLVAVVQKRAGVLGPTARIPSVATMTKVTQQLTPPASPVMPVPPHLVALPVVGQSSDMALQLALPRGRSSGWTDPAPWPASGVSGVAATIVLVTNSTHFRIEANVAIPVGVSAPSMMLWNAVTSRFEKLNVQSVSVSAGTQYNVVLTSPPTATVAVGGMISPDTGRRDLLGASLEAYFDSLGPGEVVNLSTDLRAHRAFRFPEPSETAPQRCGSAVISFLQDAIGSALADGELASVSVSTPSLPTDPILGPKLIVPGRVGVYAL